MKSFEQKPGVVENIDKRSKQLGEAIEDGKKIIVTTLQKFPMIDQDVRAMADRRFHHVRRQEALRCARGADAVAAQPDASREAGDHLDEDDQDSFRRKLRRYTRLYGFLSQVVTFRDPGLEKLYVFAAMLHRRLPSDPAELPTEVIDAVDMQSYRLAKWDRPPRGFDTNRGSPYPLNR